MRLLRLLAALLRPGLLRGAPSRDGQTLSYGFIVRNVLVLACAACVNCRHFFDRLVVRDDLQCARRRGSRGA